MIYRLSLLVCALFLFSCNKEKTEKKEIEGTYFSIVDFAKDQWSTYHGQPFPVIKRVYLNGEVDSVYTNALEINWGAIFKIFFETDISDEKFLDKYRFSSFDESITMTRSYYYEAIEPDLYTRTLNIMANYYTDKISSIYIEAKKKTRLGTKDVKLFYVPLEIITIHEVETTRTGQNKELRIEYDFTMGE